MPAPVFLGQDPTILALRSIIARVAPTDTTVLITGESGTGKELVARWMHARSRRSATPLVVVDSPSVPVSLFVGIHRATLYRKLLAIGLKPESLRPGKPE